MDLEEIGVEGMKETLNKCISKLNNDLGDPASSNFQVQFRNAIVNELLKSDSLPGEHDTFELNLEVQKFFSANKEFYGGLVESYKSSLPLDSQSKSSIKKPEFQISSIKKSPKRVFTPKPGFALKSSFLAIGLTILVGSNSSEISFSSLNDKKTSEQGFKYSNNLADLGNGATTNNKWEVSPQNLDGMLLSDTNFFFSSNGGEFDFKSLFALREEETLYPISGVRKEKKIPIIEVPTIIPMARKDTLGLENNNNNNNNAVEDLPSIETEPETPSYMINSSYLLKSSKSLEITFQKEHIEYFSKNGEKKSISYGEFSDLFLGTYGNENYPLSTLENICGDISVITSIKGISSPVALEKLYNFYEDNSCKSLEKKKN